MTPEIGWDIWDIEALPADIAEHQFDSGEPQSPESFWPELREFEYWRKGLGKYSGKTVAYINVNDIKGTGPDTTNYLSQVTYKIVGGIGAIGTAKSYARFDVHACEPQSVAEVINPKQRYSYNGQFSALVEWPVPPYSGFVTFGDEKLSKEAAKILRQAERQEYIRKLIKPYVNMIEMIERHVIEREALDRQYSELGL